MKATHPRHSRPAQRWPEAEEQSAEWFFQLFDALGAIVAVFRRPRRSR
jgi:hypothetical protein